MAQEPAGREGRRRIGVGDGADLNRNFAYKWARDDEGSSKSARDDEGSSPNPTSQTHRGPSPESEPEPRALDAFEKPIGFTSIRAPAPGRRSRSRRPASPTRAAAAEASSPTTSRSSAAAPQPRRRASRRPPAPGACPARPRAAPPSFKDWARTGAPFRTYGAVTTERTVPLGFGLEHLASAADLTALIGKALAALGG